MRPVLVLVVLALVGLSADAQAQGPTPSSARLFDPIASVLQHPRCTNCHTSEAFPRQKDAGIRHTQLVVRGKDGQGVPALPCTSCHQAANSPDGKVPGAEGWHQAPAGMGWNGLTKMQMCEAIKNQDKNGFRSLPDLIKHVKSDALVLWAWNPGAGRTTPARSHEQFVRDVEAWVAAGGPC